MTIVKPASFKNVPEADKPLEAPGLPVHAEIAEESFRLLVDSVRDYGIFLLDPVGNIRSWNRGAERIKGYSAAEIIGKNFSIFYSPEDRARHHPEHELDIASREGRYEEEGWRFRKDGTRFWANVVITRLVNEKDELVGFGKVTRDLSERKVAEEALRSSEEQARMVYENVKDYAIITLDVDGRVSGWNEGARRIKGYEASEIIGKHFSAFYSPEEVSDGKCEYELREAITTGRFEDEGWRVRKDGTKFWANVVITALYDKERRLRGFSKVTRDVTERKRGEDRLRMANEGLERRVEERTAELRRANEVLQKEINDRKRVERELQRAIQSRDEFLSIASHELRTPVAPLKLQLQGLSSHLKRGTLKNLPPERLEKMATSIDRSLSRLGKLIDSLLDVARINAGKIEIHIEDLDAGEVVREVCSRFEYEARTVGSALKYEDVATLPAQLDRTRLEQVISNLVVNAIKYGNSGPIDVSVRERDGNMILEVKDKGLGIAEKDRVRIFERFEQVADRHGSTGLGLGLYITRQIVEAQGGTISVESELGKGSTFTVKLPLRPSEDEVDNA